MLSSHHAWAVARTSRIERGNTLAIPQPGVFPDRLIADRALQPERLDARIRGSNGQCQQRADNAAELEADRKGEDHTDVGELQLIAVHLRSDQIVLGPVVREVQ